MSDVETTRQYDQDQRAQRRIDTARHALDALLVDPDRLHEADLVVIRGLGQRLTQRSEQIDAAWA